MARSFLRKRGEAAVPLEDVIAVSGEDAARLLEQKEQLRIVRQALLGLSEEDREIFLRYYYYNERISLIAEQMSLHPEAVKSRLRRGRAKLREILNKEGYDA